MIVKTNNYKFIAEALDYDKGGIISQERLLAEHNVFGSDLPHLLAKVYVLEDGTAVCEGDLVWREKNYVVKQVQFKQIHVEQQSKLFGTSEGCENWLQKNADNVKAELLKQNKDSSFQTLKAWVSKLEKETDFPENMSIKNVINIAKGLRQSIKNIEG